MSLRHQPPERMPTRSQLRGYIDPQSFLWCTGIEDTFIVDPHKSTKRMLDEYELTEHYQRWREDIDLIASLGVQCARYGIPWHRVQPSKGTWDWSWPDQTFHYMLERGISPIVDLVHYGAPAWIGESLLDPEFPDRMAEYAFRLAERFKGQIHWHTPLNEPRISAWYSGKIGWWPPYKTGWSGYAQITANLAKAIVLTERALREADPEIVTVHVDATDVYTAAAAELEPEASFRQRLVFLALDLVTGRLGADEPMQNWLAVKGVSHKAIDWFNSNGIQPDVLGINLYPMFSQKLVQPSGAGKFRVCARYAEGELVERIATMYYERYKVPIMITETASLGTQAKRLRWLEASIAAVRRVRSSGLPLIGYTWWPLYSLVGWAYRQGKKPLENYVLHMGLWDLDQKLNRRETAAAQAYRELVAGGNSAVGTIERTRGLNAL